MKLTNQQIQQLYTFTRQHYVEYFDVQTELVDHLANDIEIIWKTQPKLTFEQARDKAFKKFGVFGFMGILEERQKALSKKYWKLVKGIFIDFFKIPQIFATLTLCVAIYLLFNFFKDAYVLLGFGVLALVILTYKAVKTKKLLKKKYRETKKKWLFEDMILNFGNSLNGVSIFIQFGIVSKHEFTSFALLASLLVTIIILLVYITAFVLPSKVEELLKNQYPEYKYVTNV